MDKADYDRLYRRQGIIVGNEPVPEGMEPRSIIVDGQAVAPLRVTVINTSPQALHDRMTTELQESIEVVGRTEQGTELIRRSGGADYAGNEGWRRVMRQVGRLKG